MSILLALTASAIAINAGEDTSSRMAALFEEVCLKVFPDNEAVVALMATKNARELTPDQVKITMRDDPARGWQLQDGTATVWIEFPPYHACSVRWNTPQLDRFSSYRRIAAEYENQTGNFAQIGPFDFDQGDIHIHATGEKRTLPDGSSESLLVFDQHITDPKRRAAGETGFSVRFVRQIAAPIPTSEK